MFSVERARGNSHTPVSEAGGGGGGGVGCTSLVFFLLGKHYDEFPFDLKVILYTVGDGVT